jgi:lipoprotein-anchoring transpeptidase ErfK/SrfK
VLPPDTTDRVAPRDEDGLPWPYAFTARDHTRAYRTFEAAIEGSNDPSDFAEWEANWGFAVAETLGAGASRVVRTEHGFVLRRVDLYRANPTGFVGGAFWDLAGNTPGVPFGWVAIGATLAYAQPEESGHGTPIHRLSRVHVFAVHRARDGRSWARIGVDQWVEADHVRWITPAPPPAEVNVSARERWIDVDVASQTLVAYEGPDPVYATMVSTGDRYPTQPGVFRIWGRFLAHTMDNTESAHLANHFRLGDVPYVQFFDHDRALHAVYWHDGFGVPRSHGCVNLSPRDAAFLFRFTQPPLPRGWMSRQIAPGAGTIVRVRGRYAGSAG